MTTLREAFIKFACQEEWIIAIFEKIEEFCHTLLLRLDPGHVCARYWHD